MSSFWKATMHKVNNIQQKRSAIYGVHLEADTSVEEPDELSTLLETKIAGIIGMGIGVQKFLRERMEK